jgi:hypothetical protein
MIKRAIASLLMGGMLLLAAPQVASAHEMDNRHHMSCWEHREDRDRHERYQHHFEHKWNCHRG